MKYTLSPELIEDIWYGKTFLSLLLIPVSWLYTIFMMLRRLAYASGILPVQQVSVPVIVVGNITVGGAGKTPLIIWLAEFLKSQGLHPGVISRGYGGTAKQWPQQVRPDSNPFIVGDEPVLIAQRTHCPVAISPQRYAAAKALTEHTDCDVLLCDDGLQHYSLYRDIEIVVIDGIRRFGNGRCLPAGPLRESVTRLKRVNMLVCNGWGGKNEHPMEYVTLNPRALNNDDKRIDIESFKNQTVHAVAGVSNPERFFSYLRGKKINIIKHVFPDHHPYKTEDLQFMDDLPVVMTEKDAVKCRSFADDKFWYLPIEAKMNNAFQHRFTLLLKDIMNG